MDTAESYQVKLDAFQGPLDLLLFLIRKKKIDIHDIPISTITKDYLHYLDQKEKINLEREAEFLLIAALLIYIKSQMLLPREIIPEDDIEDPRKVLVDRLLGFQKIKAAGSILREKESEELQKWQRTFLPPSDTSEREEELELTEISLFDLAEAFFILMKKKERENMRTIKGKEVTHEEKMKEMLDYLGRHSFLDFIEYFNQQETISEAFLAFFCLLELIKARIVVAIQESLFHTIKVWLRKESPS
ncbi:MAG: segregation/condensation protein A [Candidatus Aminicenantes bacterium]|nr:segregation/condensation protein A [Candidatus Aminicenantes bacterium]